MDRTPLLYRGVIDEVLTQVKGALEAFGWDEDTVARKLHLMQHKWESKIGQNGCIDYANESPLQRAGTERGPPLSKGEKRKQDMAAERAKKQAKLAGDTDAGSAAAAAGGAAVAAVPAAQRRKPLAYPVLDPQAAAAAAGAPMPAAAAALAANPYEAQPPDAKKARAPRKNAAAGQAGDASAAAAAAPSAAPLSLNVAPSALHPQPASFTNASMQSEST